jgi:hypothetical protein
VQTENWRAKGKGRWIQPRVKSPGSWGNRRRPYGSLSYWVTVSVVVPATPLAEAAMVTLPIATGLAKPVLLTVAMELLLEVQVELVVMSPNVPSE